MAGGLTFVPLRSGSYAARLAIRSTLRRLLIRYGRLAMGQVDPGRRNRAGGSAARHSARTKRLPLRFRLCWRSSARRAVAGREGHLDVQAAFGPGMRAGVAVVAVTAVVVAIIRPFGAARSPGAGVSGNAYPTSTASVTERPLTSQTQVQGTIGDAGAYTVVNQAQGTITALPAAGQVVRQGQALYQVSGSPVVMLYGSVPAYRGLSEGLTGPDVTELNADLVTLGYAHSSDLIPRGYFSAQTAYALERL